MEDEKRLTAEAVMKATMEWNEKMNDRTVPDKESRDKLFTIMQDPKDLRYYFVWPECEECLWMNCCNKVKTRSASRCGNQVTKEQALARLNVSLLFALARKGRAG